MRTRIALFSLLVAVMTNLQAQRLVYPNPAGDVVTIEAPDSSTVTVINATGDVVKKGLTVNGRVRFDTKELGDGMYFVNVITANKPATTRLIVEHK